MTTVCAWCPPVPDDGTLSHGICAWHRGMQRIELYRIMDARRRLSALQAEARQERRPTMRDRVLAALFALVVLAMPILAAAADGGGE